MHHFNSTTKELTIAITAARQAGGVATNGEEGRCRELRSGGFIGSSSALATGFRHYVVGGGTVD